MGTSSDNFAFRRRRGFTLVELSLGLLVTALVAAALSSFTISVAKGWQAGAGSQAASLSSAAATTRMQEIVRNARLTGNYTAGALDGSLSAAVLLWIDDANGDGVIQKNECAMLEYDAASRCIIRRSVAASGSNASINYATFSAGSGVLADFRNSATVIQPIARDVDGAIFYATAGDGATDLPLFEFRVKFQRTRTSSDGLTEMVGEPLIGYGTATVRTPLRRPS